MARGGTGQGNLGGRGRPFSRDRVVCSAAAAQQGNAQKEGDPERDPTDLISGGDQLRLKNLNVLKKHDRRFPALPLVAIVLVVAGLAVFGSGCTAGSSKLFIVPSVKTFTAGEPVKKLVIEVEGPAKVKISNTEITDSHFQFVGGGGFGECLGEYVEEGKSCTEEIKLVTPASGLDGKFKVTPQVGNIVEATLITP